MQCAAVEHAEIVIDAADALGILQVALSSPVDGLLDFLQHVSCVWIDHQTPSCLTTSLIEAHEAIDILDRKGGQGKFVVFPFEKIHEFAFKLLFISKAV